MRALFGQVPPTYISTQFIQSTVIYTYYAAMEIEAAEDAEKTMKHAVTEPISYSHML